MSDTDKPPSSLSRLLGSDLPAAVGRLDASRVQGRWADGLRELEPAAPFKPPLYDESHSHEHAEYCLLLEGRCRLSLDFKPLALKPGTLVLIPGGQPHAESYSEDRCAYRLAWWILPPAEPLLQVTTYHPENGFSVRNRIPLSGLSPEADERLRLLAALPEEGRPPDLLTLKEALLTLLVVLLRRLDQSGDDLDQRPAVVGLAMEFIRRRLDQPIDLAEVGREVMLSPNYLTTLFKQHTGYSLGHYIKQQRINRACVLLEDPRLRIKEVASAVGYADPFTFSRSFRAVTGQSPTEYRAERPPVTSDTVS